MLFRRTDTQTHSCHLGDTEVPLVTDMSEVLKVKPVHFVVTVGAFAEHCHKARVVGTFLKHHHNTVTKPRQSVTHCNSTTGSTPGWLVHSCNSTTGSKPGWLVHSCNSTTGSKPGWLVHSYNSTIGSKPEGWYTPITSQ